MSRRIIGRDEEGNAIYSDTPQINHNNSNFRNTSNWREQRRESNFANSLRTFFSGFGSILGGIGYVFIAIGKYLPQIFAVLLFIYCIYDIVTGGMPFGNIFFMAIPCGIMLYTGWKGVIGIAIFAGLITACNTCILL